MNAARKFAQLPFPWADAPLSIVHANSHAIERHRPEPLVAPAIHRVVDWGADEPTPSIPQRQSGRVYHPFHLWEDANAGMWRNVSGEERERLREASRLFMVNTALFRSFMFRVIDEWPIACEVNLTARGVNHQAWIGHAANIMAVDSPEDVTRQAWHMLTPELQDAANAVADEAIAEWHRRRTVK